MKQFILFALVLSLIFVSCNNNNIERPKKPKNLIKKEMMASILYDMSLLTASKGVNKKLLEDKGILPEDFVFNKYGIDSVQFSLSNEYYAFDLDTYEQIYEDVKERLEIEKIYLDSLTNIEAEKNAERSKELRAKRDSLNEVAKAGGKIKQTTIPLKKIDTSGLMKRQ